MAIAQTDASLNGVPEVASAGAPKRLALAIALLTSAVAASVLVLGWGFNMDSFTRLVPGFPAMVPATAICILLGGIGTISIGLDWPRSFAVACGAAIAVIALFEFKFQVNTGSDGMAPATLAACAILSLSLVAKIVRGSGVYLFKTVMDTAGLSFTAVPLIGYILNGAPFPSSFAYAAMAVHTATGLFSLFLALLLLRPQRSWTRILTAREGGARMARLILPATVVIVLVFFGIELRLIGGDMLDANLRVALLAYCLIFAVGFTILVFAHRINMSERRMIQSDALLQHSEKARLAGELALERAQRIESLGQLVAGVAHEFNNLLSVIVGRVELIQIESDPELIEEHTREAINSSKQATRLTRQLLAYGGKSHLKQAACTPEDLITPTLDMFRQVAPSNIRIVNYPSSRRAAVLLDPDTFQQALLNVLINARDAMPDGGTLEIATAVRDLSASDWENLSVSTVELLSEGPYVTISVSDSGSGMSDTVRARSTEPFFTTKPTGKGSGLGLSMVQGFCRQSGGSLGIRSEPGKGTQITLWFPVAGDISEAPADQASVPAAKALALKRGRILVIDDQSQVSFVLARKLELMGYTVTTASDALDALSIIATGAVPDLVLCDVVMPGRVQGQMLTAAIRELYPELPIIMMSGRQTGARRFFPSTGADIPFLPKPVDMNDLRALVRKALDPAGSEED